MCKTAQTAAATRFTKVGPAPKNDLEQFPIALDESTGLMWDRRESASGNRQAALNHIAKLNAEKFGGFDDWRLPTRAELLTLVDDTKHSPAIDTVAFPGCKSEWYWTSTPLASSPGVYAWFVSFNGGYAYWYGQVNVGFVRAVRVGQ